MWEINIHIKDDRGRELDVWTERTKIGQLALWFGTRLPIDKEREAKREAERGEERA